MRQQIVIAGLTRKPLNKGRILIRRWRIRSAMTLVCFFLLVTGHCSLLTAQEQTFHSEWNIGVNAGMTFSKIRFNPAVPQTFLQQYEGGITFRYITEKGFGFQAEVNYSMRGWKEKTDTISYFNNYSRSLVYAELPLLTHVYFDMSKHTRFIINAGPQLGYYLSETHDGTSNLVGEYNVDALKVKNKFDYGILGGMGVELRTGIGKFVLEGRYYFGLSDVFDTKKTAEHDYFAASGNQVVGVKLTYFIK
ncbi:MAG: PorT family protein [Candidatus Symbiothrix sp.]|jgi:hypothetical protein|nr:PorT family protein [Candidatus Symbiothrix sp.]